MRIFRGTAHYTGGPCNLTVGNFDGVHLGHQAILSQLEKKAAENHLPTAILTFEPHPREYFTPSQAPTRLTTFREKAERFKALGIDYIIVLPFNFQLARISAEAFIQRIFVQDLQARYILVGDDFCFGHNRTGNFHTLQQAAKQYGFQIQSLPTISQQARRISSTAIRQALYAGELDKAKALLGRPYSMSGKVIHGNKLGRVLGYPTANIYLKHLPPPLMGIFCVEIHGLDQPYQGAASLGVRPTVQQNASPVLEVFIFDFDQQIYQQHIRIDFLKKLRDEIKFPNVISMTEQIAQDIEDTKAFFNTLIA